MNLKTLEALESLNLPEDKIPLHLNYIQQTIEEIFKSDDLKGTIELDQAMKTIHSFRVRFPNIEKQINAVLFHLHEKSLSAKNPAIQQKFAVSLLTSFERRPTSNVEDAQKLVHIMSNQNNLKFLMPMVQRMTLGLANNYETKYKTNDTDMALARLVRDFASYCYWLKSKKSVSDANWAHQITNTFAQIYPIEEFKIVANNFPQKKRPVPGNTQKLPEGPIDTYGPNGKMSYNRLTAEYDG